MAVGLGPGRDQLLKTPRVSWAVGWNSFGALDRRAGRPSEACPSRGWSAANRSSSSMGAWLLLTRSGAQVKLHRVAMWPKRGPPHQRRGNDRLGGRGDPRRLMSDSMCVIARIGCGGAASVDRGGGSKARNVSTISAPVVHRLTTGAAGHASQRPAACPPYSRNGSARSVSPRTMPRSQSRRPSLKSSTAAERAELARISWSVLHHGRDFEVRKMSEPVCQPA